MATPIRSEGKSCIQARTKRHRQEAEAGGISKFQGGKQLGLKSFQGI